jgi:hypothetical protein
VATARPAAGMAALLAVAALVAACTTAGPPTPQGAPARDNPHATSPAAAPADHAAPAPATIRAVQDGTRVPGAGNCPMFPANNVWNTNISKLPVNSHSAAWMKSMNSGSTFLHPDFGPNGGGFPFGIPFNVVTDSHKKVRVKFQVPGESDKGPYPFGSDTTIEGGKNAGGDRHAIMVNKSTCTLYELFNARFSSHPTAFAGAIWHLKSNALRPAGWTSADAAGLPILPGLLNFSQVKSAVQHGRPITHAIRFTAEHTQSAFLWPARHQAGSGHNKNLPPMGARFRLKASFNVGGFCKNGTADCKYAKAILVEMQHYGMILADNGSNWFFQGSAFPRWPDALVSLLKKIPARAFQAVNESCLMVKSSSGQARAKAGCPIG